MADIHHVVVPSEQTDVRGAIMKKIRLGARGQRKVKTGCRTCKIRHKKCDEVRPACTPCRSTGRRCDFSDESRRNSVTALAQLPSSVSEHLFAMTSFEVTHFDYFLRVCTRDFALYFSCPVWERVLIQVAHAERCIYHAAVAIGVLSRNNYHPFRGWPEPEHTLTVGEYVILQYNRAIRSLNTRVGRFDVVSAELAVLASILFVHFEGFQGFGALLHVHLRGGFALLRDLKAASRDAEYLEIALHQIQHQVEELEGRKLRH